MVYDLRPDHYAAEEIIMINPLKKTKSPSKIRDINEAAYVGFKESVWPAH